MSHAKAKTYTSQIGNLLRQESLAIEIAHLIENYNSKARVGLDIGAQDGKLTKMVVDLTGMSFFGVEPELKKSQLTQNGVTIFRGRSYDIPYADGTVDVITAISVMEHIEQDLLEKSFSEFRRVLNTNGIIIIQIPNMLFPLEPHSRLPFQQFLPKRVGKKYLQLFSINNEFDGHWYVNTPSQLEKKAHNAGLSMEYSNKFVYPPTVFPPRYRKLSFLLRILPLDFFLIFRK